MSVAYLENPIEGGIQMKRTCARIWLGLAVLTVLASGQWLVASCSQDEATSTAFREAPSGDWCAETDYSNCYFIRASGVDGDKICEMGQTDEWDIPAGCEDCDCTSETALKKCDNRAGPRGANTTVTLWGCFPNTDCP